MRLLNINTLQFEEFFNKQIPPYCILSHRCGDDEISYKEFRKSTGSSKSGYQKIVNFAAAVERRLVGEAPDLGKQFFADVAIIGPRSLVKWIWIDTCCIDKRSSAELSEAINSMFSWYQDSCECYVHLADVKRGHSTTSAAVSEAIKASDWFCRGWTLQELLAPKLVVFFDAEWMVLGHKCPFDVAEQSCGCSRTVYGPSLNALISDRTDIPVKYLGGGRTRSISQASVAARMSWAARRVTTRVEDRAYCLLGIFDVNMPLLYGEGDKSFKRLQEEIIRRSTDLSIFAWTNHYARDGLPCGVFADDVSNFADSGDIERFWTQSSIARDVTITNEGVRIWAPLLPISGESSLASDWDCEFGETPRSSNDIFCLPLNLRSAHSKVIGLLLVRRDGRFCRVSQQCIAIERAPTRFDYPEGQQIMLSNGILNGER